MTSAVIPWGTTLTLFGYPVELQAADLNIGILYVFGFVSLGVYGIMIGGWASNNKYSLYGAIRATSQMISYELAMGLSLIALIMITGTLSLREIAAAQSGFGWNVLYQPFGFLIFFICALAECNRAPFDLPECETELVGGYHTEYSSMKLGFYLFAEQHVRLVGRDRHAVLRRIQFPRHRPQLARRADGPGRAVRQGVLLHLRFHVDPLDAAALPLRPADAPRLESADPAGDRQYAADGVGGVAVGTINVLVGLIKETARLRIRLKKI
jgi:hypothetical protein